MRFVHISDIHLGAVTDGNRSWSEERAGEFFTTFSMVIDACNQKKADLLLIAGNLFHRQPLKRELKDVNAQFARLERTQVVLMAGPCDCMKDTSYYLDFHWNENVHFLYGRRAEKVYFPFLDVEVWGLSYYSDMIMAPYYDSIVLEDSSTYKLLLAHGGGEDRIPLHRDILVSKGFDYIALGGRHTPKLSAREKLAYAGCLEPLSYEDEGKHGYIMGEVTDEGTSFELVALAQREYITLQVNLNETSTIESVAEDISQMAQKLGIDNFYHIVLTGQYDPQEERLVQEECFLDAGRERGINITRITQKTHPAHNILAISKEHSDDLIGKYMETLHQMPAAAVNTKALYYGISALLPE